MRKMWNAPMELKCNLLGSKWLIVPECTNLYWNALTGIWCAYLLWLEIIYWDWNVLTVIQMYLLWLDVLTVSGMNVLCLECTCWDWSVNTGIEMYLLGLVSQWGFEDLLGLTSRSEAIHKVYKLLLKYNLIHLHS